MHAKRMYYIYMRMVLSPILLIIPIYLLHSRFYIPLTKKKKRAAGSGRCAVVPWWYVSSVVGTSSSLARRSSRQASWDVAGRCSRSLSSAVRRDPHINAQADKHSSTRLRLHAILPRTPTALLTYLPTREREREIFHHNRTVLVQFFF